MTAKELLETDTSEVFTEVDIIRMMEQYAKINAIEIIKKLSETENDYQHNIKYVFPQYNIR